MIFIYKLNKMSVENYLDQFLSNDVSSNKTNVIDGEEVCDLNTGECYIIRTRDGIVERINKKYITEDGRQLLQD